MQLRRHPRVPPLSEMRGGSVLPDGASRGRATNAVTAMNFDANESELVSMLKLVRDRRLHDVGVVRGYEEHARSAVNQIRELRARIQRADDEVAKAHHDFIKKGLLAPRRDSRTVLQATRTIGRFRRERRARILDCLDLPASGTSSDSSLRSMVCHAEGRTRAASRQGGLRSTRVTQGSRSFSPSKLPEIPRVRSRFRNEAVILGGRWCRSSEVSPTPDRGAKVAAEFASLHLRTLWEGWGKRQLMCTMIKWVVVSATRVQRWWRRISSWHLPLRWRVLLRPWRELASAAARQDLEWAAASRLQRAVRLYLASPPILSKSSAG